MLPGPFPFCTPGGGYGIQGSPSTGWSLIKAAETGVAESILSLGVSDSALRMEIRNIHAGAGEFIPCLIWPANGAGLPTQGTRSSGTRFVNRPTLAADAVDHGIGYTTDTQWYSVGKATAAYKHSFFAGEAEVAFIRGDGIKWVRRLTNRTTLGDSRVLVLRDVSGLAGSRYEIGLGYHTLTDPDGNYQPVVIGHRITDGAGNTKGNAYIATRDATTNTAPTERVEVTASGEVGVGKTPTAGVLLDLNGPLGFKSYTVATLPSAAIQAGQGVYVSDASGSPCLAISNGSVWKRCDDMTVTVT